MTEQPAPVEEVDIYRDTPVRLLGYANEVGEAFRALIHVRWVRASYGIASTYVLADTYDKAVKMSKVPGAENKEVAVAAIDTLLWQAFASVIVPGILINRICAMSLIGLARTLPGVAETARKWMVTGLGLGVIPFIVHPIDNGVHVVMDNTTRKIIGGVPRKEE
jgi:fission process protein 1